MIENSIALGQDVPETEPLLDEQDAMDSETMTEILGDDVQVSVWTILQRPLSMNGQESI